MAVAQQVDPALIEAAGRIATAQTVVMIATVVIIMMIIGAAILSFRMLKRMDRMMDSLEKVINELAPRAEPLLDGATRVAVDASAITDSVRRRLNDVLDTVEDVNARLRSGTDAVEQRIRNFGAVMDV